MKEAPNIQKAEQNMQTGMLSSEGFLGNDTRPLIDIIEADEEKMQSLGLDFDKVAERLRWFEKEGKKGLEEPITLENTWRIQVTEARGRIPCPFEDGIHKKINVEVTKLENSEKLLFSDLSIHLLQKHHFLQGKGSSFRLEPQQVKKVLY